MIDPAAEERAIQRALEDGFLTRQEVEKLAQAQARWGPRLAAFLRSGPLSEALVEHLLEDTAEGGGEAEPSAPKASGAGDTGRERFEIGEVIGQGGMGTVHRAYDTSLKRPVALKFLRSDDPDRIARFLREAQAQARVDHENVCRVYEAGELNGRPYIAMQLIEGQPLFVTEGESSRPSAMLQEMSVEQKVRILQQVAEGIHAAHREGLIHRDIKPGNIMLERKEDGSVKPTVLDFGLAREVASAGVTSMGLAAGTPNFMSPEQARGDSGALDRRTDVYGLGATLFAVLAGRPPFEGPSSLDVLVKVTEEEAPRLQNVPGDLVTIVAKCLEKEPAQRYDSARALAEDLGRYLDGEPIQAHKTSLSYRLLKRARKHKKLVASGAIVGAAFLALAIGSVRAQLRAQERARLAGVFGQEVKAIESRMRIAYLAPEHDIRPDKAAVRQRMAAIQAQIERLGSVARGPGHYALGRGHLALQEYDLARQNLDLAWKEGYREREVAYALGQVMGALYQRQLEAVRRIVDPGKREEKRKEAERDYRDPALAYLQQSRGLDVESPEYVEALVAFYERKYPEALQKAEAAAKAVPWLHEALGLEAQVRVAMGQEEAIRGQYDAATQAFEQAQTAYRAAMDVGRSDPALPEGACRLALAMIVMEAYGRGGAVESLFERGLEMCDRGLLVDPEGVSTYLAKATLLARTAESDLSKGKDARPMLAQAIEAARTAVRLQPDLAYGFDWIRNSLCRRFEWENGHGIDGLATIREAIAAGEKAVALDPNAGIVINQGVAHLYLGSYQQRHGDDPRAAWKKAEELFSKPTEVIPGYEGYQDFNLSNLHSTHAAWELDHGVDPTKTLDEALATGERSLAVDPTNPYARTLVATVYERRAQFALAKGDDPRPSIEKLVEHAKNTVAHTPGFPDAIAQLVNAQAMLARYAWQTGADPQLMIRAGWRWATTLPVGGRTSVARVAEAQLALCEAQWRSAHALAPDATLDRAQHALADILRVDPSEPDANTALAEVYWRRAEWERRHPGVGGHVASAEISRGLVLVEKALAVNPRHARALAVRGALYLEQARQASATPARGALMAKARESLEQALTVNRYLTREYAPILEQSGEKRR